MYECVTVPKPRRIGSICVVSILIAARPGQSDSPHAGEIVSFPLRVVMFSPISGKRGRCEEAPPPTVGTT